MQELTKEEAERIRCPFQDRQCVTTVCMAWHWVDDVMQYTTVTTGRKQDVVPPEGDGWEEDRHERDDWTDEYTYKRVNPYRRGVCSALTKPARKT